MAREPARLSGGPGAAPALRPVPLAVYLPSVLYGVGQGAILPVIALSARQLGASLATAGLVVALAGVGQIAGDLPAGQLAARYGERRAMLGATAVSVLALGCARGPPGAVGRVPRGRRRGPAGGAVRRAAGEARRHRRVSSRLGLRDGALGGRARCFR